MKILIWSQFSSNHSADFTLVGEFPTVEQAAEAAEKIRTILREIATFWQSIPADERPAAWSKWRYDLTPIEQTLRQQFEVEWARHINLDTTHALDWLPADPEKAINALVHVDRCVFLENIGDTYIGPTPFDTLLAKWGASVVAWREVGGGEIYLTVTCLAPDELTAENLLADVQVTWQEDGYPERDIQIGGILWGVSDHYDTRREGRKLIYPLTVMSDIHEYFGAFLDYLRENGCTEIKYRFTQG